MFAALFFIFSSQVYIYKREKKYYATLIKQQENMSFDDYIEYIKNSNKICFDDEYAIEEYKILNDFYSLLSDDVNTIKYIKSDDKNKMFFLVKKNNGDEEIISFEDVVIKFDCLTEDELIYDSGTITFCMKKENNE